MEMLPLTIQTKNPLVNQYIENDFTSFFHYSFRSEEDYQARYNELMGRVFPRKQVAEYIRNYMKKFSLSEEIEISLAKLEQDDSVVVIGGQQAGLLTGPLYSIHKIISIILLAKQQEQKLGKPVVPVFWIAGEDHDIYEVNHVYTLEKNKLKKKVYHQKSISDKQMVSKVKLNKEEVRLWYKDVVCSFGETTFTNNLLQFLDNAIEEAKTYTEFFACIINEMFKVHGLLLIDSADPELRKIEQPFFDKMARNGEKITELLLSQQEFIKRQGFQPAIETAPTSLQLFFENHGERVLLYYEKETGQVSGKGVVLTKEELFKKVQSHPELFSNNVVTRPIMQELLFPNLAFIAGPGEITYWAELKSCFELFDIKMPPIVPRLNITLLERNIESDLKELKIPISVAVESGVEAEKFKVIQSLKDQDLEKSLNSIRHEIEEKYRAAVNQIVNFDKGLEAIIEKNSQFVLAQLDYLKAKVEDSVKKKNEIILDKFDRIEQSLHPQQGYQERCWNVFYFINQYGFNIIDELLTLPYEFNGKHYVIIL